MVNLRACFQNRVAYPLIALVLALAVCLGVLAGNWWAGKREAADEARRTDEYVGLGQRTGLTGDVELLAEPKSVTAQSGKPIKVTITLVNKTRKNLSLSNRIVPAPWEFKSNQFPIKVIVTRDGRPVRYRGNIAVLPLHTRKDFFTLKSGERRSFEIDPSKGPAGGRWDISAPGNYAFEIWYETYLTGKYIGVNSWTGMTNHAIVRAAVLPTGSGG